ncbi:hypothetical protein FBU30_006216 [Linnemannia zychae]|nr:hypothetical protein FBU30_006216 [Linnemannia zychae]
MVPSNSDTDMAPASPAAESTAESIATKDKDFVIREEQQRQQKQQEENSDSIITEKGSHQADENVTFEALENEPLKDKDNSVDTLKMNVDINPDADKAAQEAAPLVNGTADQQLLEKSDSKTPRKHNEREPKRRQKSPKTNRHQEEDHEIDTQSRHPSDEKYRRLKRKLKEVLEENERLGIELERSNRRARNLRREKNILLDKICTYERESDSSIDTLSSISSDSEISDSSLYSHHRSRRTSPIRTSAPPTPNIKHLRVPVAKDTSSPSQVTHHPKKTANKGTGRRSPAVSVRKDNKETGPVSTPSTITNVGSATQKPKRIHNSSKLKPNPNKVRKVQAVERDENGNIKFPLTIGIITIMKIGHVVSDREAFHNERYIWPVGYTMSRSYNSMVNPNEQTIYTCSVIDDGEAPKFQIDAEDQPGKPIIAGTATGAWTHVVKTANAIRKRDHSNSASGPDYFGFSNATIAKMIQDLPHADECKSYIMQRFEEPSAKPSSAPEKRKNLSLGSSKDTKGENEEEEEEDDDDEYASLGTPKKKIKRAISPKTRLVGSEPENVNKSGTASDDEAHEPQESGDAEVEIDVEENEEDGEVEGEGEGEGEDEAEDEGEGGEDEHDAHDELDGDETLSEKEDIVD